MFSRYGFEISYLISTMLMMYSIYRFLDSFFASEDKKIRHIWAYYVVYYLLITTVFLVIHIPVLTMSVNAVVIFFICTRYVLSLKKAFVGVVFTFIILILVEGLVGFLIMPQYGTVEMTEQFIERDASAVIIINLLQYVLVMFIVHFVDFRAQDISVGYLAALLALPLVSIYIMIVLFQAQLSRDYHYILVSLLLLVANFLVFFLYGLISRYLEMQHRESTLKQQNDMYARQYELMRRSEASMRSFRHDHNHHMAVLTGIANQGSSQEMKDYLASLGTFGMIKEDVVSSGNIVLDSIVNYHLAGLEREGIEVTCRTSVIPQKMMVEEFDMTSILSNLLANAVEGTRKAGRKRIDLELRYDKGIFFINIENTFDGVVDQHGEEYKSLKTSGGHGIGIANIRRALEKYDGQLRLHHNQEWFEAEAMMYLKAV